MKGKDNADKDTNTDAKVKINTNAFIRQVSVAGSNANMQESMDVNVQAEKETPKETVKKKKGQPTSFDYELTFLNRNELSNRQGLYISKNYYEVLQTLVRSIRTERLSVSGLVDNIINHHIELYGDEINRIYEENIKKPIKK